VSIGDRVFKFRVDAAATATVWSDMIMAAKKEQILETGKNNPLVITNISGDNTDGTKFWRTKPVGYVENFNAAMNTISAALPTVSVGNKGHKDISGLSRKQIEALLTFETLICLNDTVASRVANAFFDCCVGRPRATQERTVSEESNNICRLLGHSIAHWLIDSGAKESILDATVLSSEKPFSSLKTMSLDSPISPSSSIPTPLGTTPRQSSGSMSSSGKSPRTISPRGEHAHAPTKTSILEQWIDSCVLHEFHRFSSRQVTDFGTLRHGKMPFRSRSITGLFLS
jgi:hypothetical protein